MKRKAIFLCGFMGCGKSTVGRTLARRLGAGFADLDDYIVKKEGRTIPEIFSESGEEHFRRLESAAVCDFTEKSGVVACGGGTMLRSENAAAARKNGVIVYIDAPFELCYGRIRGDKNRPIAASRTEEQLRELFSERRERYLSNSDISVSAEGSPAEIAERIIDAVRLFG